MPNYEVTSPSGKKYRVTAPDGATQDQVLAYAQQQFASQEAQQAPATQAAPKRYGTGKSFDVTADGSLAPSNEVTYGPEGNDRNIQAVKNVGEGAAKFTTGMVGGLAGDVAGLGALGYDITANAVMHPFSGSTPGAYADPSKVRERVSQFLTYQPSNPESVTSKVVDFPGRVFNEGGQTIGNAVGEWTKNPYLGDVAAAAPLALASWMGVKGARPVPGEAPPGTPRMAPEATPQETALQNARSAGYKVAPDKANAPVGTAVGKMAGHADLEREMSMHNATVTDNLAKKALGVSEKRQLTEGVLNEVRAKANQPYNEVSKTGAVRTDDQFRADVAKINDRSGAASFPEDTPAAVDTLKKVYGAKEGFDAGDAVAKIRQLRKDAAANLKLPDPEKNALGTAQRQLAEALDNQLERHVTALGKPDLVQRYKAARVQLAKLHSVEDAFEGGHVSARELAKQKGRGVPLSGDLKLVADSFEFFDRVMQEPGKIRARGPLGVLDTFVLAGGAGAGLATGNPALVATALARPAARAALRSELYQNRLAKPLSPSKPVAAPNEAAAASATAAPAQRQRKAGP